MLAYRICGLPVSGRGRTRIGNSRAAPAPASPCPTRRLAPGRGTDVPRLGPAEQMRRASREQIRRGTDAPPERHLVPPAPVPAFAREQIRRAGTPEGTDVPQRGNSSTSGTGAPRNRYAANRRTRTRRAGWPHGPPVRCGTNAPRTGVRGTDMPQGGPTQAVRQAEQMRHHAESATGGTVTPRTGARGTDAPPRSEGVGGTDVPGNGWAAHEASSAQAWRGTDMPRNNAPQARAM